MGWYLHGIYIDGISPVIKTLLRMAVAPEWMGIV